MAEIETSPMWAADMASGKDEKVIYYRRKNGWITWGDTQASKQLTMIQKGATPLPKYGYITSSPDLWGPILRHPDGPAEFPVDQVLAFRWYKDCPVRCRFPQLAGVKIVEFPCPEPCNRTFHSPLHLGGHLRVMHGYDRSEILKYGDAMGIDFSKVPGGKAIIEYDQPAAYEAAKEIVEDAEYDMTTVSAQTPATEDVAGEFEVTGIAAVSDVPQLVACPDCGKEVKPAGLQIHQLRWCKKAAVPA